MVHLRVNMGKTLGRHASETDETNSFLKTYNIRYTEEKGTGDREHEDSSQ